MDAIAAAWLVLRFVPNGEVVFLRKQDDKSAVGEAEWFCFNDKTWQKYSTESLFTAVMKKLALDDPALRKIDRIVADADTRGRSPSPLAISLTALLQGWKRMPTRGRLQGEAILEWALPVFDALYANFQNQLSGPSH